VDKKRGCLDPTVTGLHGDESRSRRDDSEEGEIEHRLSHRCKHGGGHQRARVRVQTLIGRTKKKDTRQ
jgi:hypothetical protein